MFTLTEISLQRLASPGPSSHTCTVCVGVGVGDGDAVTVGDGDAVTVGDGDAVTVGDGDAVTVGDGDAVTVGVGDGDAVTVGDGDAVAVGVALAVALAVAVGEPVAVAVAVALAVAVAVTVGVGVGQLTFTQSPLHSLFISTEPLSYTTCSPLKFKLTFPQLVHDTLKFITASVPLPVTPFTPPTLLMIRTTPCIPAGMNPQSLTGTALPPMSPSNTPVTCRMSGSYDTS